MGLNSIETLLVFFCTMGWNPFWSSSLIFMRSCTRYLSIFITFLDKKKIHSKKCKNKKIGKIIISFQSVLVRFCLPLKGLFQKSLPFSTPRTTDTWWLNSWFFASQTKIYFPLKCLNSSGFLGIMVDKWKIMD